MQKLVVDTNVLVSAMISEGYPGKIVAEIIIEGRDDLCISPEVWEEYEEVLQREKFRKIRGFLSNAEKVLAYIKENALVFIPSKKSNC